MEPLELLITDRYADDIQIKISDRDYAIWEARLATALIERWGLVACEFDGEDSAGRRQLRRLTPDELVTQATETAAKAIATFRELGWIKRLPALSELVAEKEAADAAAEKSGDKLANRKYWRKFLPL